MMDVSWTELDYNGHFTTFMMSLSTSAPSANLPDLYDDPDLPPDLVDLRSEYGENANSGQGCFSNHTGQPSYDWEFRIDDTHIGGAGYSRGNYRFVFCPEAQAVYYT